MNLARQFLSQDRVDAAVSLDAAEPAKCCGNDLDPEMTFTIFARTGMARMQAGFIDDGEPLGRKRCGQFGPDGAGHGAVGGSLGHLLLKSVNVALAETCYSLLPVTSRSLP